MIALANPVGARPVNAAVADRLDEVALLLEQQRANPFRVRAYRHAAESLKGHPVHVGQVYAEEGLAGLERIPDVGESIARAIRDLVVLGRLPMLERLRGESDPVGLLASVPGIGPALAERLHLEEGIGSLEELEQAAHDGRLEKVAGFGPKRITAVTDATAARLGRVRQAADRPARVPAVGELLDVDREYREGAKAERLAMITPRRFNPEGRAWLPVLHTARGDRHYTALFSNTALAHRLGRTHDWVVIYSDGARHEHQATVVTARSGPLAGRRVVRGRERECAEYFAAHPGRKAHRGARP